MHDVPVDVLAAALTADPRLAVDPEAMAAADPDQLAEALRRAVADLPPTEQRTRLASAFRMISASAHEAAIPGTTPTDHRGPLRVLAMRVLSIRPSTPARAGLLVGIAVAVLLGGLLAVAVTDPAAGARTTRRTGTTRRGS